nr:hypothetical protein [uncultured Acetatifactor sp.]
MATLYLFSRETAIGFAGQQHAAALEARGIPAERIRKYGFAFQGKKVLIG